ncbi:MAG: VWA domain-containing protein [Candidatus Accumulibacter phosphatis]|jgi:Ca-activated chloride channel family protein|uniref:VWA domain-containing protein n=1 Tax=Candidatus Accumulibacter contiguus TaxID=2954381 RepID=A0ABX1TAC7_9PROT|nr:VWA domain-containing protein [Candidatus Accumulibacter contiguus]NMQ06619.1 VWA domain-containing protein [Candidatus Accumulibacter contiguus]
MNNSSPGAFGILLGALLTLLLSACGPDRSQPLTSEQAHAELAKHVQRVAYDTRPVRAQVNLPVGAPATLADTLPDIAKFPVVVEPAAGAGDVVAEIFSSIEKSGNGSDGWLTEVARDFNAANEKLADGRRAQVRVRNIASGTAYQFIASRKYVPDAYTPSSHLWIRMTAASGMAVTPISERLAGNLAGVVLKKDKADKLRTAGGQLDVKMLIDATVQERIVMGYTDPYASTTGLNFLLTVLQTFAGGETARMLAPDVESAFEGFQSKVPFVAITTLQMRDSVQSGGSLDAFVMERQTFANMPELSSGYEFVPFGERHDNPLYALGKIPAERVEVLKRFAAFATQQKYQANAAKYGFNSPMDHKTPFAAPPGEMIAQVQKLWKKAKNQSRPVAAVFLCDISGSMQGSRLRNVKQALLQGSDLIAASNSIGMVLFNDKVTEVVPIKPFDLRQKATLRTAIAQIDAAGGTAMYDGIAVALSLLVKEKATHPDVQPMLFVLTDGETNQGMSFDDMRMIIKGLNIPIYAVGYEADIKELARLSGLVEAANLNAGEGDIGYKIGSLLNAQM